MFLIYHLLGVDQLLAVLAKVLRTQTYRWLFAYRFAGARGAFMVVMGLVVSGCGGQLDSNSLATGAIEAIPASALALAAGTKTPVGTPTEIYTRIARGALSCWLGGQGELRKTHAFHAVASPRRDGGRSRIIIYQRPQKAKSGERGLAAFRILISPQGSSALVQAENLKLPKALGERMVLDTQRWAAGEVGCIEGGLREGWRADLDVAHPKKSDKK